MFRTLRQLYNSLTHRERVLAIGAAVIFSVSFVLWGITQYTHATEIIPAQGGTYREGVLGQPVAVNPLLAARDADLDLVTLTFANLEELMEEIEEGKDGASWIVTLKEKLFWSDGEPITTDDVIFTIETIQDPDARSPLFPTWQGVVVERLSERQFRMALKTPYAFFIDNLHALRIAPEHIFGAIPAANLRLSEFNLEPVGSGPYMFAGFDKRKDGFITRYRVVRNSFYSGASPYIDEIEFRFYATKDTLLDAFNSRAIDGMGGLDHRDISALRIGHHAYSLQVPSYYALFFNQAFSEALKHGEVREALTRATNKPRIVEEVFGGHALIVDGPIVPYIEGYNPEQYRDERFSREEADEVLDAAGWTVNEDGVREKIIGGKTVTLEFQIVVPQVDFLVNTIELIRADWEQLGVRLTPILLHPQDVANDVIKSRNYQMLIFGTILKNNPDVFSFWHSSERFYPGGNLSLLNDRSVDRALEAIKTETDSIGRRATIQALQAEIDELRPVIFLYTPTYFYVTSRSLRGFDAHIIETRASRFANVTDWFLNARRSFR